VALDIKDAFLIEACRRGHGDIKKIVKVVKICKTACTSLTDKEMDSQILNPLRIYGYIKDSAKDEVIVTRKGY
jgi:hypothetical protein